MIYRVTTWHRGNGKSYGSKGRNETAHFDDKPTADRWAKDAVESRGAWTAHVEAVR